MLCVQSIARFKVKFSDKEAQIIKRAERRVKQAVVVRVLSVVFSIALISLFFLGQVSSEKLAFSLFGLTLLAYLAPQLGTAPKYEQLASLLASKLRQNENT